MKKIYSTIVCVLASMALTCASAGTAARSLRTLENAEIMPLNTLASKANLTKPTTPKRVQQRDAEATESSIYGDYYALYYYLGDSDWDTYITPMEVVAGASDEEVTLKNFYLTGIDVEALYDASEGAIFVPKQKLYTYNGHSYCLQAYQTDGSNVVLSSDDLLFFYDDSDGSLMNLDFWGITVYNEGEEFVDDQCLGFADYCMMMLCVPTNGKTYLSYEYDGEQVDDYANVICELEDNQLSIDNFNNNGTIVTFDIDPATMTATAENQTVATITDAAENIYFAFMCDLEGNQKVVGTITGEDNNEIAIGEWASYFNGQMGTKYFSTRVVTPFNLLGTSGVSNVSISNDNAPVEYFNLQGIRVANPTSGLYIRRQGNKAAKVVL